MSRIERWTRQLLEVEARKRSIRDPELRSRAELLRAIVQHDYGARQSLRNARKFMGSLLEGAAQALPLLSASRRDKSEHSRPAPLPPLRPQPPATRPATPPAAPSSIRLQREPGQLQLSWQVNEQDIELARRVLGHDGELSLRIVCVQADPTHIVRSEITEHGPLEPRGAWTLNLPGPDSSCVGSVGVRHGERFVSIAHQSSRSSTHGAQPAQTSA